MPVKRRAEDARMADRAKLTNLATALRTDIEELTTAIGALPAPASRNAAQKRDALIMRSLIRVIRWCLITSGAGMTSDRSDEPA